MLLANSTFPPFDFEAGEVLLFDKPLTWTSFDVVAKVRNTIRCKKVGHAGTLDPLATGLLVLCTGKMTKQIDHIQADEKEYLATVTLGKTTPSYDLETTFNSETDISHLSTAQVEEVVYSFLGRIQQLPPVFSAIKVGGKKLYELARKGKEAQVEIKPRDIEIYAIAIERMELPEVVIRIRCTKGTYVRSLAHDIGQKLGVGAHLSALCRTKIGDLSVENAYDVNTFVHYIKSQHAGVSQH
jgi:tRNA pseudouridine55 synthase